MQDYRKLKVWEKSHAFALDVHRVCGEFPRGDALAIVSQLRRAALSIPSNIAEGAGKSSDRDFRRFLNVAMGSAMEADYQLLLARDAELLDEPRYSDLAARIVEIRRMLGGLIKRINATLHESRGPRRPPEPKTTGSDAN
jgi:four helix bundle protein